MDNIDDLFNETSSCVPGMFLPVWEPVDNITIGQKVCRGITYVLSMYFIFIGVAYLADVFMSSIERITSTKKEVRYTNDKGEEEVMVVRIWNQTIANLSLIALGGAAPEVFLANIELIKNKFDFEDLGPSEMVASASFNVMVIISVCIFVIPKGESRRIQNFEVFLVVVAWSMFAYLWLVLATAVISPGEIKIWEAIVTLLLFPCSLVSAYMADLYSKKKNKKPKTILSLGYKGVLVEIPDDQDTIRSTEEEERHFKRFSIENYDEEVHQFEENRREYITTLKELRNKYPLLDAKQLELMANKELEDKESQHGRVSNWSKISKKLTGNSSWRTAQENNRRPSIFPSPKVTEVFFSPGHYTVDEHIGMFKATVVRRNGDLNRQVLVDYRTEDGDAIAGRDYCLAQGTICFQEGETKKTIEIAIIDDLLYEGDQHFYIRLSNLRYGGKGVFTKGLVEPDAYSVILPISRRASKMSLATDSSLEHRFSYDDTAALVTSKNRRKSDVLSTDPSGSLLRLQDLIATTINVKTNESRDDSTLHLACPSLATVLIMDDDHSGIFSLEKNIVNIDSTSSLATYAIQVYRYGGSRGQVVVPYHTEEGTALSGKDYKHCEGELLFNDGEKEKTVIVELKSMSLLTEDLLFFFVLGQPKSLLRDGGKEEIFIVGNNSSVPAITIEEASEIEEDNADGQENKNKQTMIMNPNGLPQLGEIPRTAIRIKECKEIKGILHKLIRRSKRSISGAKSTWRQQFVDAIYWEQGEDEEEEEHRSIRTRRWWDYVWYGLTIFWRLLFALIPPPELFGGFATFASCIFFIAILVVFLGDMAYALGCTVGLEIRVTSLVFVSVGTSVPDLFSSRVFAKRSPTADACITNVFGSNIIQIYLGIGLCWMMGSIYHYSDGTKFEFQPGALTFMGTYLLINVTIVVSILLLRRKFAGGELGGSTKLKMMTTAGFICMWVTFVLVNSFEAYGYFSVF